MTYEYTHLQQCVHMHTPHLPFRNKTGVFRPFGNRCGDFYEQPHFHTFSKKSDLEKNHKTFLKNTKNAPPPPLQRPFLPPLRPRLFPPPQPQPDIPPFPPPSPPLAPRGGMPEHSTSLPFESFPSSYASIPSCPPPPSPKNCALCVTHARTILTPRFYMRIFMTK
jgi:hypothetical protein